jgi:arylformamidase
MHQIIDITLPLDGSIPVWPGSEGLQVLNAMSISEGDPANVTLLRCDVHTGTHIDVPRHYMMSGKTTEDFPLGTFIGPAYLAHLPALDVVTASNLEHAHIPLDATRLLIRTDNSARLKSSTFDYAYTYLTGDAAAWIATRGFKLLGFDYLSIEQYGAPPLAHLTLLQADVVILEGIDLYNLHHGWYELICLPLRLVGREGAPVRAVLKPHRSTT